MSELEDGFGRRFHYLRLSLTEACNFRCAYCLPNGYHKERPNDFLRLDEIGRLVSTFAGIGMRKVRLTGGEATTRKDIGEIIALVAATPEVAKVALSTNGWNLKANARAWRDAGLTHINVSADSLDRGAFRRLTGHDRLDDVIAGIDEALASDFASVKMNAVLLRETAEQGFSAFADFIRERPVAVRFIELMRTGDNVVFFKDQHVSGEVLRTWLGANGWTARPRNFDDGPAIEYEHPDFAGRFGLIAPYAPGFCDSCNRLRVTARGDLRLCLFGEGGLPLRDLLQSDGDRDELIARVTSGLVKKTAGHRLLEDDPGDARHLAQMGG